MYELEKYAAARLTEQGLKALKGAVRLGGSTARVKLQDTLRAVQDANLEDPTLEADLNAARQVAVSIQPDELQAWQIGLKTQAQAD